MRKLFEYFPQGSSMHVVLHAMHRRSRGRRHAVAFGSEVNPRRALAAANRELDRGVLIILVRPCPEHIFQAIMVALGMRELSNDELGIKDGEVNVEQARVRARELGLAFYPT